MQEVFVVTGGNKGIGLETTRLLAERFPEAIVLLGTRSVANGHAAIAQLRAEHPSHTYANIRTLYINVASASSVEAAAEYVALQYGRVDGLVQNAGVVGDASFDVNLFGIDAVFDAFRPLLAKATQLTGSPAMHVIVSSEFAAWTTHAMTAALQEKLAAFASWKPQEAKALALDYMAFQHGETSRYAWPAASLTRGRYGISKALGLALGRIWAGEFREICTVSVCPGYCDTTMNVDYTGARSAEDGAKSVLFPILHPTKVQSGLFYQDGKVHPWACTNPFGP
ncbi:hypothetical protein SDRG_11380 [Saprolegnia diclina VS20]|uniref:Uncharacterized protein n=1 Tax=Saprolegnia diclina (strain VS20) TaxID=1156394 RepID=T0PZA4_SAPDV|nr:hypothetical protein SDRG_11380 [Saprolegnia diclina VS20]EQC30899.1 hypothetical protein SDRG_11380 [Saprolegnia diclina VS20]|eukprot:XP_008615637.1 hypothetical protein SDRG_11380 [Saprolegnia diclina VS20]